MDLPHAILVDGEHGAPNATLGAVGDEYRVFHGHETGHGIDLLALQPLGKTAIGLFQTLLVEIVGNLRAGASVVVHASRTAFPHT